MLEYEREIELEKLAHLNDLQEQLAAALKEKEEINTKLIGANKKMKKLREQLRKANSMPPKRPSDPKTQKKLAILEKSNAEKEKELSELKRKLEEMSNSHVEIVKEGPAAKRRRGKDTGNGERTFYIPDLEDLTSLELHVNYRR